MLGLLGCGSGAASSGDFELFYALGRQYVGTPTNTLTIEVPGGADDRYTFSLSSPNVIATVEQDVPLPLESQTVGLSFTGEGVFSADFKVAMANGQPFVFEIMTWEYSTELPDPPVISFSKPATRTLLNSLLVSDSRTKTTNALWLKGDLAAEAGAEAEDDGFWTELDASQLALPITLTPGDGVKTVEGKFRNVFGNVGAAAVPASIILKQAPPVDCDAIPLNTTIANNKLSLQLRATDPFETSYSVVGDVKATVSQNPFADGDVVTVFVEPSPGNKDIVVYIEDIAGNVCLSKRIAVLLDPAYESEGIFVQDHKYWTDDENVVLDVYFDHFPDQEPLEIKITGDVGGANTHGWLGSGLGVAIELSPSTTGNRRIYAQYRDVDGTESYLIGKQIFLKPGVTLVSVGAPMFEVRASNIAGADTVTIDGCAESAAYVDVAYATAYLCEPVGAVSVTWKFPDGSELTRAP